MKKIYTLLYLSFAGFLTANAQQAGTLDSTFNATGKAVFEVSPMFDNGNAVAIQPDSNIVIVGSTGTVSNFNVSVLRLKPDGTYDSSFANNGIFIYDYLGNSDFGYAVKLQPDGKIIVAGGVSVTTPNTDFYALRLNTDGTLDSAFGNNGIAVVAVNTEEDYVRGIVIQPDGKIVLGGNSDTPGFTYNNLALARLETNGTLDTTFGINGIALANFATQTETIYGITMTPAGKFIAVGYTSVSTNYFGMSFGFDSNGFIDSSYGVNGLAALAGVTYAYAIERFNDKYYIAGYYDYLNSRNGTINAVDSDGTAISTYGTGGQATINTNNNFDAFFALTIQPDGKVVAGGSVFYSGGPPPPSDFLIARFDTLGVQDLTFAGTGFTLVSFTGSSTETCYGLALQADQKIIAAGTAYVLTYNDVGIIRLNNDTAMSSVGFADLKPNAINVFPNPVNDFINIVSPENEKITKVALVDLTGRSFELKPIDTNRFEIPAFISKGTYIIKITTDKHIYQQKIIK